jgi:hypothetical protein
MQNGAEIYKCIPKMSLPKRLSIVPNNTEIN